MTGKDHEAWIQASDDGDSNIEILTGERLNERQLLQALMIPSADNIADYLATWDAGSVPAFVAKMNAEAVSLGLSGTHYADASGVNPGSRSTAVDMATLASVAMENPELRSIVDEQSIRLPVAGEIWNVYNPAIGVDGIIGVKSGFTDAAQANLVTAAWRVVAGHRELVVSAAVDQPLSLWGVAQEDEALLGAATRELRTMTLVAGRAEVGQAVAAWNHSRRSCSVSCRRGRQALRADVEARLAGRCDHRDIRGPVSLRYRGDRTGAPPVAARSSAGRMETARPRPLR
jgi:D-alanyl-D-alanine carboxypeptidase